MALCLELMNESFLAAFYERLATTTITFTTTLHLARTVVRPTRFRLHELLRTSEIPLPAFLALPGPPNLPKKSAGLGVVVRIALPDQAPCGCLPPLN